jgi:hypothetical protein
MWNVRADVYRRQKNRKMGNKKEANRKIRLAKNISNIPQ